MARATKTKDRFARGVEYYDRFLTGSDTTKKLVRSSSRKLTTAVTFSADDLAALADYIAAGMVMLRITMPHRAVSKFKAAMSRLRVPIPRGL